MPALRKIERDRWSDDIAASAQLALSLSGRFTKGPEAYQQRFTTASAGTKIGGNLGGGTYNPAQVNGSFTAPVVKP